MHKNLFSLLWILASILGPCLARGQASPKQQMEATSQTSPLLESKCPGANAPAPPVLKVDIPNLISALEKVQNTEGRAIYKNSPSNEAQLKKIFESTPTKTKLEQFFQLLFLIQNNISKQELPMIVEPPSITQVLLAAKVFTDPSFPKKITRVHLQVDDPQRNPYYTVNFSDPEVHFSVNQGKGFVTWDQGMCQIAKELIFYNGFSFRIRNSRINKNLLVDDFNKVQIYGDFGTRKIFDIDLNYLDLEKVEFVDGTDQGKIKARVAKREFKENKHSGFFKFIGSLIPNTSQQRIDW